MTSTAASGAPDAGTPHLPLWVVAGPTAAGKTAVAIALALRSGGEIIAADSRQVYRGMTIGSAQPTAAERARVPHHLVDFADPLRHYTAADFARDGRRVLADLDRRRTRAIVAGGSGLYLRALVDGLFAGPPRDLALRAALETRAEREGTPALHAALALVDPESAGRLHPNDRVRLIRALEVHAATGRPLSALRREAAWPSLRARTRVVLLDRDPADLDGRIAARTAAMFAGGLLAEAEALRARGLGPAHATARTIGYREAFAVLAGTMGLDAAVAAATLATRQFARRQRTWFRREAGALRVRLAPEEPAAVTADRLLALLVGDGIAGSGA